MEDLENKSLCANPLIWWIKIFNESGYFIEGNNYKKDGSLEVRTKYNDKGKITEEEDKAKGLKYTYKYDDKGSLIEEPDKLTSGKQFFKYTYFYDDKNNPIELICHYSKGGLLYKYTYKYDDKGKRIEESYYEPTLGKQDGKLIYTGPYKYDDKGNLIEEPTRSDGFTGKFTYKYDNKSNRIEAVNFLGGNKTIFIHDDRGTRLESRTTKPNGRLVENIKYDVAGNSIEETSYKPNGRTSEKITHTYEYDKNMNWIKRVDFLSNAQFRSHKRVIVYY